MNITRSECVEDMTGYGLAGVMAIITLASEIMPMVKKIPYNGLLHIFTSKCFRKKKEKKQTLETVEASV